MDGVVIQCLNLSEEHIARLEKIARDMPIVADISRADLLIYCPVSGEQAKVVAHARPHSIMSIYSHPMIGQEVTPQDAPYVFKCLRRGRRARGSLGLIDGVAPVVQEVYPIKDHQGQLIGALSVETNLIERERHRRRSRVFQRAVARLQDALLRGELEGTQNLTPFGELDGILVVGTDGQVQYASGIATNLYRRLGYLDSLVGRRVSTLETEDERLVLTALREGRCIEEEVQEQQRIWIRKVIPLPPRPHQGLRELFSPPWSGVIITIHDDTEARRKEQELKVKSALIQEIHHRVKNNLARIAALLRMEARRASSAEARRLLSESVNRILSVAVIHEFLSQQENRVINIRDVSQRIVQQMYQGIMAPEKHIHMMVRGPSIFLPAHQATACALIINELLHNAVEHAYPRRQGGTVVVNLQDGGDRVTIEIRDDGGGLPPDFDLEQDTSLGLQIVHTLAQDDLKGEFVLRSNGGVSAIVTFPKQTVGGEEQWSEFV